MVDDNDNDNETRLRDSARKRRSSVRWTVYQKEQRALKKAAKAETPPRFITLTEAYDQLAASRGWDVDPSKRDEAMAAGYHARYGTTWASERPAATEPPPPPPAEEEQARWQAEAQAGAAAPIKPVCVACHELKNLLDGTRQIGSCDDIALAAPMMGYSLLKLG